MTILEIHGLKAGYTESVSVLNGIDFSMRQGEAVGIIGLNGSGKSTFGKSLMNMIPFRTGSIMFHGRDISSLSVSELARTGIRIMLQGGPVFNELSVYENLLLAYKESMRDVFYMNLKTMIPLLNRPDQELRGIMADKLSGGQRHQLALAVTLAMRPELVILDEPSAGLSPKAVDEMYALLAKLHSELDISIVLIEQNINKAIEFCGRCLLISQGVVKTQFVKSDPEEMRREIMNNLGI